MSQHTQQPQPDAERIRSVLERHDRDLARQIADVSTTVATHLERDSFRQIAALSAVTGTEILPFAETRGQVLPASSEVLTKFIPGYREPDKEAVAKHTAYASDNYGSAPGPAVALIEQITRGLKPDTVFCIGTGKGRLESIIAESHSDAMVVTIDLPQEIVDIALGRPGANNRRYRDKLGVKSDEDIGSEFKQEDGSTPRMIKQLLGDSFTFRPAELAGTQRMIVIDGNHSLPTALMDLANALELAHQDGAVIVMDDFRKQSDLNSGVEAAAVLFSQLTALSVLRPCPPPEQDGFKADAALIVVPASSDRASLAQQVRNVAELLPRD